MTNDERRKRTSAIIRPSSFVSMVWTLRQVLMQVDEVPMTDQPRFLPASSFTLDALADIFTGSFAEYFYPGVTPVEVLARRVRSENLDLRHSLVMLLGDEPAGQ